MDKEEEKMFIASLFPNNIDLFQVYTAKDTLILLTFGTDMSCVESSVLHFFISVYWESKDMSSLFIWWANNVQEKISLLQIE